MPENMQQEATRFFEEAGNGGFSISTASFVKFITAESDPELSRREMPITQSFGDEFRNHITDPTTRTYVGRVAVQFKTPSYVYSDCECALVYPPGQDYPSIALPRNLGTGGNALENIFKLGGRYILQRNGVARQTDGYTIPRLLAIVLPSMSDSNSAFEARIDQALRGDAPPPQLGATATIQNSELIHQQRAAEAALSPALPAVGQMQQNNLANPRANEIKPTLALLDPASRNFIARPLDENDPGLSPVIKNIVAIVRNDTAADLSDIIKTNRSNLNKNVPIQTILEYVNHLEGVQWPTHAANRPQAGQIYVFDKKVCGTRFRDHGHPWNQNNSSNGSLKIEREKAIKSMYNYTRDNPALNRRVYSLRDENKQDIIFVHYSTRTKENTRKNNGQASRPVEDMDTDDEARHNDFETDNDNDDDGGDEPELQSDSDDDRADPDYDIDNGSDTDTEEDHTLDTEGLVDEIADASLCAERQDGGKGEERAPHQPAESQLKAVSGLLNMVNGVDRNEIQKKMRQQRKQIRDTAVVPESVAIQQLAQEAANNDLSDKLQKLDVAAAEPSIYSTPVHNHYGDPGASGSRQPAQPGQDRSMAPPAAVPATANITKSGGIKDLVDTKLKMYLEAEVKVPILEKKVQVLQSELEAAKAEINAAKKQVDAAVEAAVKANDAEHDIKLKDISEKHKAAERVWQQRLEAANANAVAAQRHADKISQEANELKEQIQEKDTALAAQKKQCKKRNRAHLRDMEVERSNAASSAKKYQKIEEKLRQRVKDLARVEEEDSQGPTETDSSDDSDAESHIESSSESGS